MTPAKLNALVSEATVDCHDEEEQLMGLFNMIEENLVLPFQTSILGATVMVGSVEEGEDRKKNLQFPLEVTGIEDFDWEEFYILGPGEKKEYERLKKHNPPTPIAMTFSKSTRRPIPSGCSSSAKTALPLSAESRMAGSFALDSPR